jgi:Domain of unknown function (DUF4383)
MIESHWDADLLAKIFGLAFLLLGAVGFTENSVVSAHGFFVVNDVHSYVHVATGVLFLAGALLGAPVTTIRVVAILYTFLAIAGFAFPDTETLKGIQLNTADRWLNAGMAIVLLLLGFLAPIQERLSHAQL